MFEVFAREFKKRNDQPVLTINKKGRIGINRQAYESWFADNEFVLLAYDPDNKRIGIKSSSKDRNTFKVSRHTSKKGHQSFYINALSFLNHYNLTPEKTEKKSAYHENDFVVINI